MPEVSQLPAVPGITNLNLQAASLKAARFVCLSGFKSYRQGMFKNNVYRLGDDFLSECKLA